MNTKHETYKRLRAAIALAKQADGSIPQRPITEVQTRVVPTAVARMSDYTQHPDDDLVDFWNINESSRFMPDEIREDGAVVHIAFAAHDAFWGPELITTVTVWLGTDDEAPQLIHVP